MIASLDVIDSMHAGKIKQQDCDAVNSGAISEEVGRCSTNHLGQPRDDCDLLRVGDLIWSVPLSFPISDRLAHSMSWAVTRALSDGMFEAAKESGPNKAAFPVTQCTHTEDRSETDGHLAGFLCLLARCTAASASSQPHQPSLRARL